MKSIDLAFINTRTTKKQLPDSNTGSITPTTKTKRAAFENIQDIVDLRSNYNNLLKEKQEPKFKYIKNELVSQIINSIVLNASIKASSDSFGYIPIDSILQDVTDLKKQNEQIENTETKYSRLETSLNKEFSSIYSNNKKIVFETVYQENISDAEKINYKIPAVLHYGINTQELSDLVGAYLDTKTLHPIEHNLFKKAFDYLISVQSTEKYLTTGKELYPNNVVLVDIFARENDAIKNDKGVPETHTIALWKKKAEEIVLIDPSKVDFSSYMKKPLMELANITITTLEPTGKILYGSEGKPTEYSAYSNPKPSPRDCVDIAIKVGFEIQEQQKSCSKLQDIQNNMLQQISNQKTIAPHMSLVKNNFVRTLQSSNNQTRIIAKDTLHAALYIDKKK